MAKAGSPKKRSASTGKGSAPPESRVAAAAPQPSGPPLDFKKVLARAGGLVVMVALLALLVTVCRAAYAEYSFHTLPAPQQDNAVAIRLAYLDKLKGLLDVDPSNSEIRSRVANLEGALGHYQKAIDQLKIAMQTQRTQNSLYFLAQMHEELKNWDEAERVLADAVEINPNNIEINQALLRLINRRVAGYEANPARFTPAVIQQGRADFSRAAVDWSVRAFYDPNAWLFLGNAYVKPLQASQAYKSYLIGFNLLEDKSSSITTALIPQSNAMMTIEAIGRGGYAPMYRGLP